MTLVKAAALGAALAAVAATGALAKAHNQANTAVPGANVGAETGLPPEKWSSLK